MRADVCDLFDEKELELFRLLGVVERIYGPPADFSKTLYKLKPMSFPIVLPTAFYWPTLTS